MRLSLGSDGPPTCYADIELADTFLFVGSNAADCHPIVFDRVVERVSGAGAKCIAVDPRQTRTTEPAHLHLAIKPGTDLVLLNGLLRILRDEAKLNQEFIAANTDGWQELEAMLDEFPTDRVAEECGTSTQDLHEAARLIGEARRLITFWTMGINQSVQGTFSNNAIINLHLALGQIGKAGCGPFSLTGQPNAMGGRDCGYMSHSLPGQRLISDSEHRRQMEQLWGLPTGTIRPERGHDAVRMFDALEQGELKAIWIIGSNPAATMPNLPKIRRSLSKAELVIVQDAYYPTETTAFAHLILPAAVNLEQDGTFCNSERRVTLMEQVVEPPGDAKPDWWWIREVAAGMGFTSGLKHNSAAEIFDEFARTTAGRPNDQSALHHELLTVKGPQQWPYPAMGKSSERRYTDAKFPTPTGKARFWARRPLEEGEKTCAEYPLVLTSGRVLNQWHTRTKSGNVQQLNKLDPAPFLQIHPDDARELRIEEGDQVQITSRRGRCQSTAKLDPQTPAGTVFMPMHWNELWCAGASPNEASSDLTDPISKEPALKCCAVCVQQATS
jgi:anaerobic selenocysteine-containing dehydrogenase